MARGGAVLMAVMTLAVATSCGSTQGSATGAASTSTEPRYTLSPLCPPAAPTGSRPVVTAADLNRVVADADLPGLQAADIGASARLSDGRIVWAFGDTLRRTGSQPAMVANSILVSSGLCLSQLVEPRGGAVVPDRVDGVAFWPMSVAVIRHLGHDGLVLFLARVRRGAGSAWDFTYLGSSAAVFDVRPNGVPQLVRTMTLTRDDTDLLQVNWGAAATVRAGWLYVYGTRLPSKDSFGRELYVARGPLSSPDDLSTWRFWDGSQWQPDRGSARPVLPAAGGVSQTLSVASVGDRFVVVSKRDGDLGDFVYTWTSAQPTGPWAPQCCVAAPFEDRTGVLQYAPLAHPEVALASGKLLVSISRNTTDLARLVRDPHIGRPVFVEIAMP